MKKAASTVCAIAMMCILPMAVFAQTPEQLKGAWVIDAKQTAELMKKTPRPREPGLVSGVMAFWFLFVLEFDDEGVTLGAYRADKTVRYRLVPSGNEKVEYALERPDDLGNEILTISFLGDRNIHIKSSRPTLIELCAWQRGSRIDPKSSFEAGKQAIEAWKAVMQSVAATWESTPEANKDASR